MSAIKSDQGSALIWFMGIVSITVSFILVLSLATSQYLLARKIKDYSEQYALSGKLLISDGLSETGAVEYLRQNMILPESYLVSSFKMLDDRTLEVSVCAKWNSPNTLIAVSRAICEVSLAR